MLKVSRSRNKIVEPNFSHKMNGQICFFILTTQKYLKLEFQFQVSSISESSGAQDRKTNSSICFFWRSYGLTILFRDLLTFRTLHL